MAEVALQTYSTLPALNHAVGDLIRRKLSGSVCNETTRYRIAILELPTKEERGMLAARQRELLTALKNHDRKRITELVVDMLASYDVARQRFKTKEELRRVAALYARELDGVPTWAVAIACDRIRMGTAPDISHIHEPTTIQMRVFAISIAEPFAAELSSISKILAAEKWIELVDEEVRARVLPQLRQLADEMKAKLDNELYDKRAKEAPEAIARTQVIVEQDYRMHGQEPPLPADGIVISRFLKAALEAQKKAREALPPHEPLVL